MSEEYINRNSNGGKPKFLDELDRYISKSDISSDDICLVGSAVLADHGIRDNRDLDIAIDPKKRGLIDPGQTPKNVSICIERYSWFDVADRDLIHENIYHYKSNGYKIVKPEIELSFKHRRRWDKDDSDIKIHEDRFCGFCQIKNMIGIGICLVTNTIHTNSQVEVCQKHLDQMSPITKRQKLPNMSYGFAI